MRPQYSNSMLQLQQALANVLKKWYTSSLSLTPTSSPHCAQNASLYGPSSFSPSYSGVSCGFSCDLMSTLTLRTNMARY